ncbi:MAG TPA: 2-oxoglutarate dehydrogenase E1 component [Candidatus Cryosericum sp.]|nr:2-oxoglutarate dehydrogenase E1 component [Candidatus Cryosericum sp.]
MAAATSVRDAFRRWGYLQADLDSFGRLEPLAHPEMERAKGPDAARWRRVYCGPIGAEFMHLRRHDIAQWFAAQMEREPEDPDRRHILERLARAELLERFMHRRWVGSKRYSLEGSASVVPLLDAILDTSANEDVALAILAMSHRGRLNVLVNIVGRPARDLFALFEDIDPRSHLGGGDVRYHLGATGEHATRSGRRLHMHLVSNPSHLEAVNPVMMGRARARQDRIGADGRRKVLPLCLHGDAAFAGQGITAETLNLHGLAGFDVGGTVHVVINNLIGFTTPPTALHGSRYATDVARRLDVPILHVNGQDPEAVVRAGRMAAACRARFATDVVVDVIGFRRYGHSEVDDPTTTQPVLYRAIERTPMLWQEYGAHIGAGAHEMEEMERRITTMLSEARGAAEGLKKVPVLRTLPDYWAPFLGGRPDAPADPETGVTSEHLRAIAESITSVPESFRLHPKVKQGLAQRMEMARGERPVDWGMAEALAFGSLLRHGVPVRLAGQDSRRGTFNHRHAVLFDAETGEERVPLQHLAGRQARFAVHDTPLSEASALAFEYGYSRDYPEALVCWEAQFGDFANGAQVIIDQFISAGEDKWDLRSGLVLLLPHGHEGQGPEHSSARLERFLQLCAEDNMQVCQPSTAAQYFHLLRRQVLRPSRKPLVVMTPKGLLRAEPACSPLSDFSSGRFRPVLPDAVLQEARRVLIGTGRILHALRAIRKDRQRSDVAILALEQIYPFPDQEMEDALAPYQGAGEIVWIQEEPGNMGAETFVRGRIQRLVGDRHVTTIHRSPSASPASGSSAAHRLEEETLLRMAFATHD